MSFFTRPVFRDAWYFDIGRTTRGAVGRLVTCNHCRNSDTFDCGESRPWCYTTHPKLRWDYCSVPTCSSNTTTETTTTAQPTTSTQPITTGHLGGQSIRLSHQHENETADTELCKNLHQKRDVRSDLSQSRETSTTTGRDCWKTTRAQKRTQGCPTQRG